MPFVIYADFECITTKLTTESKDKDESYTNKYQEHKPCGYAYHVVSCWDNYKSDIQLYRGEDCMDHFMNALKKESSKLIKIITKNTPMIITKEQTKQFNKAINCHICDKELGEDRVRDHCHESGEYRGAAHNKCNVNYNYKDVKIPVIVHNLKGYDSHLIIMGLKNQFDKIDCIPTKTEKYLSITLNKLCFIDSFSFLSTSVEKLVDNLRKDGLQHFKQTKAHFKDIDDDAMKMITTKGVYPYDWADDFNKFNVKSLPTKEDFFSTLNNEEIKDKDYQHALQVWDKFKCKTFGDYHDLYLKTDVLLLADVFESFRDIAMTHYKLDPTHYFSLPGFAWDAMLYKTKIKISLFDENQRDMYEFIESGIRGGISMISNRYERANNSYLKDHDKSKPSSFITYLDANNLYGWAMSQKLPFTGFEWVPVEDYSSESIQLLSDDATKGYVFEVDLDYPKDLHDSHNDYPLAPESVVITKNMLSPYSNILNGNRDIGEGKVAKLVPNLRNKKNYILHYRNLKL